MTFTILHISDIHVTTSRRHLWKRWQPKLPRGGLTGFAAPTDAGLGSLASAVGPAIADGARIVVSGDITADGHDDELSRAFDYLFGAVRLRRIGSVGLNAPSALVIPGNHDVWGGGMARALVMASASRTRVLSWSEWHPFGASRDPLDLRPPLTIALELLVLDSTQPSYRNFFARGEVDEVALTAATDQMGPLADAQPPATHSWVAASDKHERLVHLRVAVMHHPVHQHSDAWALRLKNRESVAGALGAADVGLLLCGHDHHGHVAEGDRLVQSIAGTGPKEGQPASYVTVEVGDIPAPSRNVIQLPLVLVVHRWSATTRRYEPDAPLVTTVPARIWRGSV